MGAGKGRDRGQVVAAAPGHGRHKAPSTHPRGRLLAGGSICLSIHLLGQTKLSATLVSKKQLTPWGIRDLDPG